MMIYFGPGEDCRFQIVIGFGLIRDASLDESMWRYHWQWSFGCQPDEEDEDIPSVLKGYR